MDVIVPPVLINAILGLLFIFFLLPHHGPSNVFVTFELQPSIGKKGDSDGIEFSVLIDLFTFKGVFAF